MTPRTRKLTVGGAVSAAVVMTVFLLGRDMRPPMAATFVRFVRFEDDTQVSLRVTNHGGSELCYVGDAWNGRSYLAPHAAKELPFSFNLLQSAERISVVCWDVPSRLQMIWAVPRRLGVQPRAWEIPVDLPPNPSR